MAFSSSKPLESKSAPTKTQPCNIEASAATKMLRDNLLSFIPHKHKYTTPKESEFLIRTIVAQNAVFNPDFNPEAKAPEESTSLVDYPFMDDKTPGHPSYPLTLLMHGVFHGCIPMVAACINAGGSVAVETFVQREGKVSATKTTALLESCHKGNEAMAFFLVQNGASGKVKDLLPIVARKKMPKLLKLILNAATPEERKSIPELLFQLASEGALHNVIMILENMLEKKDPLSFSKSTPSKPNITFLEHLYLQSYAKNLEQVNERFYILHWLLTQKVRVSPVGFASIRHVVRKVHPNWEPKLISECLDLLLSQFSQDREIHPSPYGDYEKQFYDDLCYARELKDRTNNHEKEEKFVLSTLHGTLFDSSRTHFPEGVESIICGYAVARPAAMQLVPLLSATKKTEYTIEDTKLIPFVNRP